MKAGLILAFFVISTVVFFSAEQKDGEQAKIELSAEQFGIVPEVGFSEKLTNISERISFLLIIEKYFGNPSCLKNKIAATFFKSYLDRTIGLIPFNQKPFRQIIIYSTDKQDHFNLS